MGGEGTPKHKLLSFRQGKRRKARKKERNKGTREKNFRFRNRQSMDEEGERGCHIKEKIVATTEVGQRAIDGVKAKLSRRRAA